MDRLVTSPRRTNRWTGATGSEFRIIIGPAELLGNAVARSTQPFGGFAYVMTETLIWVRFVAMIAIFVGTCFGLGYLTGHLGSRWAWPTWAIGVLSICIAFMWPAIAVGAAVYGARTYRRRYEGDPADAPAMVLVSVITVGVPLLFAFGLPLAIAGVVLARRRFRST